MTPHYLYNSPRSVWRQTPHTAACSSYSPSTSRSLLTGSGSRWASRPASCSPRPTGSGTSRSACSTGTGSHWRYCPVTLKVTVFRIQGWKFSDFSLISDFFTLTIMKIIFEISSQEKLSHDFIIDPDFQKKSLYYFRLFH